jgi:hypothetical protein
MSVAEWPFGVPREVLRLEARLRPDMTMSDPPAPEAAERLHESRPHDHRPHLIGAALPSAGTALPTLLAIIVVAIALPLSTVGGVPWDDLVDPGFSWSVVITLSSRNA